MANGYISQLTLPDNSTYKLRDPQLKVYSGTCDTAAGTAIKEVACSSAFVLEIGAVIFVTFDETNTAAVSGLKMRINNTTDDTLAKPIKHQYNASEENLPGKAYIKANQTYEFYYDGINWIMVTDYNTNSNTLLRTFASDQNLVVPLLASCSSTSVTWTEFTSGCKDYYGAITASTAIRPTVNLSTGKISVPGGIIANSIEGDGSALTNLNGSNITGVLALANFARGAADTALMGQGASTASSYVNVAPEILITNGNASNAPKVNVKVLGVTGATAKSLNTATTGAFGVTKLYDGVDSSSTTLAATANAVKTAYDTAIGIVAAADALVYKGTLSGSVTSTTYTPAANCGDTYKVDSPGLINGQQVETGDLLICTQDGTTPGSSNNNVSSQWNIIQNNIDGAVFKGSNAFDNGKVVIADGYTGKVKTSEYVLEQSVTTASLLTDHTYTANKGIGISGNTFGHTNDSITVTTVSAIYPITIDSYGHITSYGSAFSQNTAALYATTNTGITNTTANNPYLTLADGGNYSRVQLKAGNYMTISSDANGVVTFTGADTHHTVALLAGANNTTVHSAVTDDTNIYLCLRENNQQRSAVQLHQGNNMTISSDNYGIITFDSTDTKNTAGSTNNTSKLYLIGATSQTVNPQTYSHTAVFETNGAFSAKTLGVNGASSADKVTLQWNSTDLSLDFIFA